uniref:Lipocalin/cytosolic fatty-acid binding domain-containing protein n=1 Tax=Clastoptera arizonana TaxID=38151 RepID=A0A1B6D9G1_9HEMI
MDKHFMVLLFLSMVMLGYAYPNTGFGQCGDTDVKGLDEFCYKKFVGKEYDIAFVPDNMFYRSVKSASIKFSKSRKIYTSELCLKMKDETVKIFKFQEEYLSNSSVLESELNQCGKGGRDTFVVTFYGIKENAYAQYYICANNGNRYAIDARFVLVPKGYLLPLKERFEIYNRDKEQKFFGEILELYVDRKNDPYVPQ